jgi:hypothetical protein
MENREESLACPEGWVMFFFLLFAHEWFLKAIAVMSNRVDSCVKAQPSETMKTVGIIFLLAAAVLPMDSRGQTSRVGCFPANEVWEHALRLQQSVESQRGSTPLRTITASSDYNGVTIQGKFIPPVGHHGGGRVVCFDDQSLEVVAVGDMYDDGSYTLTVPMGGLGFFVDAYDVGPNLFRNVVITGPMTKDFQMYLSVPAADRVRSFGFNPQFIFNDGIDTTTMTVELQDTQPDSLFLVNDVASFLVKGEHRLIYRMSDDGTNGDAAAGDNRFALSGIAATASLSRREGKIDQSYVRYAVAFQSGQMSFYRLLGGLRVGLVDPSEAPGITVLAPDVQRTPRVVNISLKSDMGTQDLMTQLAVVRRFYQFFPDVYDFIQLFYSSPAEGFSGFHYNLKSETIGVGMPQFALDDYQTLLGSAGYLKGVNWFPFLTDPDPPLWHETAHQWGNFTGDLFSSLTHWGYSDVDGVLGGFKRGSLTDVGGNNYNVEQFAPNGWKSDGVRPYADLELYLAGLLPPDSLVRTYIAARNATGFIPFHADSIAQVDRNRILGRIGQRIPNSEESQRKFASAFLIKTDSLLSPAGMAFFEVLARSLGDDAPPSDLSFSHATGGRAEMSTLLDSYPSVSLHNPALQIPAMDTVIRDYGARLRWTSVNYAASYEVAVSAESTFSQPSTLEVWSSILCTSLWVSEREGPCFWRVRARNSLDWGPWSGASRFQIQFPAIPVVSPATPEPGTGITTKQINFSWYPVTLMGMTYRVQISQDSIFSQSLIDTVVNGTSLEVDTTRFVQQSRYWWRVQARAVSRSGQFCSAQSIWIGAPSIATPDAPNLQWGDVGSVEDAPLLVWFPSLRTEWYQIQISSRSDFAGPLLDSSHVKKTWLLDEIGIPGVMRFFRVRAFNRTGASDWSAIASYTPRNPGATLLQPAHHSIQGAANLVFRWRKQSSLSGPVVKYLLSVIVPANTSLGFGKFVTDTATVHTLVPGNEYYWSLAPIDPVSGGVGNMTGYKTFTTKPLPPAAVQLVSPLNGAAVRRDSVVLRWSQSDSSTMNYWVEIKEVPTNQTVFADSTVVDTVFAATGLVPNTEYSWCVRPGNGMDWGVVSPIWRFRTSLTGLEESVPWQFGVSQNYPNPFNPSTIIKFELPSASLVSLTVYDILGREVSVLVNEKKDAGTHEMKFDGSGLSSGMYFYRIQAGDFVTTKRLLLLK